MIASIGYPCDGGNRTLKWSQFCDGINDCYDRFDEEGHFCKLCINNLYSCSPKDEIRCDLACKMLHYVPCQTIQDRRACNYIEKNFNENSILELFKDYRLCIVAAIVLLFILIGIFILIKYFIRTCRPPMINASIKSLDRPIETDTLSTHIYEQCYEPPPYETPRKSQLVKTYYEHVV